MENAVKVVLVAVLFVILIPVILALMALGVALSALIGYFIGYLIVAIPFMANLFTDTLPITSEQVPHIFAFISVVSYAIKENLTKPIGKLNEVFDEKTKELE